MISELNAIFACTIAYVLFEPHKYVFGLGYFDARGVENTASVAVMFVQLLVECVQPRTKTKVTKVAFFICSPFLLWLQFLFGTLRYCRISLWSAVLSAALP